MKDEASPRPWVVQGKYDGREMGVSILSMEKGFPSGQIAFATAILNTDARKAEANAALIVKAVNLFDDLVAALGDIVSVTKDASMFIQAVKAREIAQAMIKKAKED